MLPLPQGPWEPIVTGNWDGIDISYYENPDKEILIFIFDKRGSKILGAVMLAARFFLVQGDASKLVDKFSEGNVIYLKKRTPTVKLDYLAVVSDPIYAEFKPADIIRKFNKVYSSLSDTSSELRKLARQQNLILTELRNANEEEVHRLFGEPLALPTVIVRKPGEKTMLEMKTGKMNLGLKVTGEKAQEIVQNLILSVIVGSQRKKIIQVLIEEAVLNGVTVVLYDEDGSFANINKPNPSMEDFEKFELSQPMGMPTRVMEPGIEIFIEFEHYGKEELAELLGVTGECVKILEDALKTHPETIEDLANAIDSVKIKKYPHERVLRILKYIENEYGDLFRGKNDAREILAPWLRKMGRVTYIKLEELPEILREGVKLCVTKSIHRFLKSELPRREVTSLSIIEVRKGKIYEEYLKTLKLLTSYGHGLLLCGDNEIDMDKDCLESAKIRIDTVSENEAVIKVHGKKPYRIKVRPTLASPPS